MSSRKSKSASKKSLSKIPTEKEYKEFSVAHQNVLLERMEKNISVIAEGHTLLNEKIDRNHQELSNKIENLQTDVTILKTDVSVLKTDVSVLKSGMERLEEIALETLNRLKNLEARVSVLEEKFEAVSVVASHFQDFEERFHHLEQRVVALESRAS